MTMEDWAKRLDKFLEFDEREVLQNAGKISAKIAKDHAESEFEKYRIIQDCLFESDFDKEIKTITKGIEPPVNNKHKLGLPLEYQQMPEYFDAHNVSEETEAKNALIESLLKAQQVHTVLDMTCGTGSQVFYLAERGYEVVGSDFSPALIENARNKASKIGKNIIFLEGDMRELHVGKFDAVITIFNAIGHLVKEDFEKALRNIHANLKDNGVYIFDIFNIQAITDAIINDFKMDIESIVNGVKIRNVQHSELDRKNRFLTSHDHYTIFKDGDEPEIYTNSFSLQIYTAEELQTMLIENGFKIIHQYDMDGKKFIADKSLNILTVARKKT